MKQFLAALILAAALPWAAAAEDLYVGGLGTFPFRDTVHVTDGNGTAVESMMRRNMNAPGQKETKRSALMRFLTVPAGMRPGEAASGVRLSQLVVKNPQGIYTMLAFVFSGDEKELFRGDRKAARFWEEAFQPGTRTEAPGRDRGTDAFVREAASVMAGKKGEAPDFRILGASPWTRYNNADGTVRWQQDVQCVVTNPRGLVIPMRLVSALYRNWAGRYYLVIFTGGHESGRVLSDDILYALYQVRREKV